MRYNSDYVQETERLRRRTLLGYMIAVSGIIIVSAYFVYQTRDWILLPQLFVDEPADGMLLIGPEVLVEGKATPGVHLTVNGVDTYNDKSGLFRLGLLLPAGLHTITVIAENRFGRTRTIERQIVVEENSNIR